MQTHTTRQQRHQRAIGSRIRSRRTQLGWSQSELAHELGVTQPSVSHAEAHGLRQLPSIHRWAKALGCDARWLAYGQGQP